MMALEPCLMILGWHDLISDITSGGRQNAVTHSCTWS